MTSFTVAQLDDIDEIKDGRCPFHPVRQHLGITTFGVNAMRAHAAGDRLINEHDEADSDTSEELYFVACGHASFELDGETRDAPAGTFVLVQPAVRRTAFAHEAGTTVLAIGGAPAGTPYEPNGWEMCAPLMALYEAREYARAAEVGAALLADDPPFALPYYNTACLESLTGQTELALTHLRRALELRPTLRELAREDEDFAAVRGTPAFAEIVAA